MSIMLEMGLEISKPYHDIYSLNSRRFKCLGLIKDLVISLTQILTKIIVMDILVADILAIYDMLLSISLVCKLGVTLQMYL